MKKKIISAALATMVLFSATGCQLPFLGGNGGDSTDDSGNTSTPAYKFTSVCSHIEPFSLEAGETKTIEIGKDISEKNYVQVKLSSEANLLGSFVYCDVNDSTKIVTEEFFIEPSENVTDFRQFLDAYRPNGVGQFNKKLLSVTLKNLDAKTATVKLSDIGVCDRDVPDFEKELYLEKDNLKVGADLAMGGTLSYLEKTSWEGLTIDEVVDFENNITIDVNAKENCAVEISSSVNLINICDAGREFQQSYYAEIGGTMEEATGANGYDRRWSYTATTEGYYWPYNPVQGGDEVCNLSQIIDYEVTEDQIYVKVRAMDWANGKARPEYKNEAGYEDVKNGRTTKSYIENWYSIKDGMLFVSNRFIDWNGFSDMDKIDKHTMEIPAAYVVHPLSNYVTYSGYDAWNLADETYDRQGSLAGWVDRPEVEGDGPYITRHHPEDWFAWVNDNDFGVGVYVPGTGDFVSGRDHTTRNAAENNNRNALESKMANEYLYNKKAPQSPFVSCYVGNTSYTAPVVSVRMKEYVAFSYSYVVAVDYLDVMRAAFKGIYESGEMPNDGLKAWD